MDVVVERLKVNAAHAKAAIAYVAPRLPASRSCACARALETAVITSRRAIPAEAIAKLGPIASRVLGDGE